MARDYSRRNFLKNGAVAIGAAATTVALSSVKADDASGPVGKIKIIGVSGSPRKGKTTYEALQFALEGAFAVDPDQIETELIELVDYDLLGSERIFGPAAVKGAGNFDQLASKLADPSVRGIIFGSPTHNGVVSALCVAFFGQIDHAVLPGKIGGALVVGGAQNGGQEAVVNNLNTYLFHEKMILTGAGPSGRTGALLWNRNDTVKEDAFGIGLAKALGERVATTALAFSPRE